MAILKVERVFPTPARYIVVEPPEQSDGFDAAYQEKLAKEQRKMAAKLNEHKPTQAEILAEAERNRQGA
jgi:hypothetical protein